MASCSAFREVGTPHQLWYGNATPDWTVLLSDVLVCGVLPFATKRNCFKRYVSWTTQWWLTITSTPEYNSNNANTITVEFICALNNSKLFSTYACGMFVLMTWSLHCKLQHKVYIGYHMIKNWHQSDNSDNPNPNPCTRISQALATTLVIANVGLFVISYCDKEVDCAQNPPKLYGIKYTFAQWAIRSSDPVLCVNFVQCVYNNANIIRTGWNSY